MAHFAKKSIDSKTRQRLQRHADSLPNMKGTVRQLWTAQGSTYVFDGSARNGMLKCVGHALGGSFPAARSALDLLGVPAVKSKDYTTDYAVSVTKPITSRKR